MLQSGRRREVFAAGRVRPAAEKPFRDVGRFFGCAARISPGLLRSGLGVHPVDGGDPRVDATPRQGLAGRARGDASGRDGLRGRRCATGGDSGFAR